MTRFVYVLGLGLLALAAGVAALGPKEALHPSPTAFAQPAPPSQHADRGCPVVAGEDRVYAVQVSTRYRLSVPDLVPGSRGPVAGSVRWQAKLHVQVQAEDPTAPSWLMSLREVEVRSGERDRQALLGRLEIPAAVTFDADCRIASWSFEASTLPEVQDEWKLLLSLLEVVVPREQAGRSGWEVDQLDPTGEARVRYERLDEHALTRRRLAYRTLALSTPGVRYEARIGESEALVALRETDGSLDSIAGVEAISLVPEGKERAFAEARTVFEVARIRGAAATLEPPTQSLGSKGQRLDRGGAEHFDAFAGPLPAELAEARALFERALAEHGLRAALGVLVPFLRAHPEDAWTVLDVLREEGFSPDGQRAAFLALELAGTEEARAVLAAGLGDASLTTRDRLRAAAALPDVAELGEGLAALEASAHDPEREVADAARLNLGRVAARPDVPPEERARIREELTLALDTAGSPGERVVAMEALANAGHPAAEATLTSYLDSPDPLERAAAMESLGRLGTPPPMAQTVALLEGEGETRAQRAIAEVLASRSGTANPELARALEAVGRKLLGGAPLPASVAKPLVVFLGAQAPAHPQARDLLASVLSTYQDRDVRRLVGRYLPP